MRTLVVDASAAAAFVIAAQATPESVRLLLSWGEFHPIAPYVFALETRWLFLRRERRERIPEFSRDALHLLGRLRIELEAAPPEEDIEAAFALAVMRDMGLYDAMYVMLAAQTGAALATRDGRMVEIARSFAIDVLDLR